MPQISRLLIFNCSVESNGICVEVKWEAEYAGYPTCFHFHDCSFVDPVMFNLRKFFL